MGESGRRESVSLLISTLLIPSSLEEYQVKVLQETINTSNLNAPVAVVLPTQVTEVVPEVLGVHELSLDPGTGDVVVLHLQVVVVLAPLEQLVVLLAVDTVPVQGKLITRNCSR